MSRASAEIWPQSGKLAITDVRREQNPGGCDSNGRVGCWNLRKLFQLENIKTSRLEFEKKRNKPAFIRGAYAKTCGCRMVRNSLMHLAKQMFWKSPSVILITTMYGNSGRTMGWVVRMMWFAKKLRMGLVPQVQSTDSQSLNPQVDRHGGDDSSTPFDWIQKLADIYSHERRGRIQFWSEYV